MLFLEFLSFLVLSFLLLITCTVCN